jgi:hypothetical protein
VLNKPDPTIIWTDAEREAAQKVREKGKWEGREAEAISKVKAVVVEAPTDMASGKKGRKRRPGSDSKTSLDALVESGWFETTFKTGALEEAGWRAHPAKAEWYFVGFYRMDGLIRVGPMWLINLADGRILPKNAMARAGMNPRVATAGKHFARQKQVIGAIANHKFKSGVTLGGVMLIHFSRLARRGADDRIVGWTVIHDYGESYRAHFQWVQGGAATYADFEFQFDKKAVRARNLQAGNLMNLGRDFQRKERVSIMPASYNPDALRAKDRWIGKSRKACAAAANAPRCRALARVLQDKALIGSLEWLLTSQAGDAGKFSACKADRRCKWTPREKGEGVFEVEYTFALEGSLEGKATWEIDMLKNHIVPRDEIAEMAFLAVHPRP